jgi:hypothetical protein
MGFLFYVQVTAAILTCALVGAFLLGASFAFSCKRFFPETEDGAVSSLTCLFVAIGFCGGVWLCIARLI